MCLDNLGWWEKLVLGTKNGKIHMIFGPRGHKKPIFFSASAPIEMGYVNSYNFCNFQVRT